jgi:hypothetical protein
LGPQRIFKCPHCKEIHNFKITHFGIDPSLPTHGDNAETGIGAKVWALMLGPLLASVVIGYILLFTFQYLSLFIILLSLGIAWTFVYIVYLYRKVRVKGAVKGMVNEAM